MIKLKEFFSLKRVSFFILIMPFYINFIFKLIQADKPPYSIVITHLLIILIFDYLYLNIFFVIKKSPLLFAFLLSILILNFYYSYFLEFFILMNDYTFNLHLRARYILPELLLIIIYLFYKYRDKKKDILFVLNIFCIFFSFFLLIDKFDFREINKENIKKENIKGHPLSLIYKKGNPIILIITDEYASPHELIKNYSDSSIFNFEDKLINNHWIVKDKMFSADTSTINSLASLFNFNFQANDQLLSIPYSKNSLKNSTLYDSLGKKKIIFYNYGIFDIGKSLAMSKIYFYEDEKLKYNFIKEFISETMIANIFKESNSIKLNRANIEITKKRIAKIEINSFVYLHLLMPHTPYEYEGTTFSYKGTQNGDNLANYYEYWKFSNKVLTPLLSELTEENKYRIILTGDHGFRGDNRVNAHYTFTAFYGFDSSTIKYINSVQDIGSLINSSY